MSTIRHKAKRVILLRLSKLDGPWRRTRISFFASHHKPVGGGTYRNSLLAKSQIWIRLTIVYHVRIARGKCKPTLPYVFVGGGGGGVSAGGGGGAEPGAPGGAWA